MHLFIYLVIDLFIEREGEQQMKNETSIGKYCGFSKQGIRNIDGLFLQLLT